MTKRRMYTSDEDALITEQYSTHTLQAIAAVLERDVNSLQQRTYLLQREGRLSPAERYWHRNWTEAEEEYLANNWGTVLDRTIGKRLRRTADACHVRADRLGVARKDNLWTSRNVARLFGVDDKTVVRWLMRGWIRGKQVPIRQGANRLWNFDDDSLEEFVRTMPWAYDWRRMTLGEYLTNIAKQVALADPWLTADEAARHIGWQRPRLNRWITRGVLPHKRRPKHRQSGEARIMVRKADLAPFLATYAAIVHTNRSEAARRRMSRYLAKRREKAS